MSEALATALREAINGRIEGLHTALPAQIESYDHATQKASVLPLIRRVNKAGEELDLPVITDVPVVFPGGGGAALTFPIEAGDTVLLVFSERSLDNWLQTGGVANPAKTGYMRLSDAIAIPGLKPFNGTFTADNATDVLLSHGAAKLRLTGAGTVALGAAGGELLDLLDQLLTSLQAAVTATSIGPQPLSEVGTFASIQAALQSIKGSL